MKNLILPFLLAVPFSASAVIPVQLNNVVQEDIAVRAFIEIQVNDFDVDRDQDILQKAVNMNPLELIGEGLIHLTASSPEIPFNYHDLENPSDWKRQFKLVIWINRAA